MSRGKNIFKYVFTNFINSLRPRQIRGNLIGEDYFGNKYYEIPRDPALGKRKAERWFEPAGDKDAFDRELTAEWQSWLEGRRYVTHAWIPIETWGKNQFDISLNFSVEPPTNEELKKNLAIMQMKKINAAKLDEQHGKPEHKKVTGLGTFPEHQDKYRRDPLNEEKGKK